MQDCKIYAFTKQPTDLHRAVCSNCFMRLKKKDVEKDMKAFEEHWKHVVAYEFRVKYKFVNEEGEKGYRCNLRVINWYMHDSCMTNDGKVLRGAMNMFKTVPAFYTKAGRKSLIGNALKNIIENLGDDDMVVPPRFQPCLDMFAQNPTTNRAAVHLPLPARHQQYYGEKDEDEDAWENHHVSKFCQMYSFGRNYTISWILSKLYRY